jgi:carboxyl-terminal processing protease
MFDRGAARMLTRIMITACTALGFALAANGATTPEPADRGEAREFERLGQWERASEAYLRLLAEDRNQPETRQRLAHCLRHVQQIRRHNDPSYRNYVAALPLSQALALYSETVSTIQRHYVSPSRASTEKLYRHGLDELRHALADAVFCREHLAGVEPAVIAAFLNHIDRIWATKTADELREFRLVVRDLAWDAQKVTGLNPSIVVLEMTCGACHALDEYSRFVAPGRLALDAVGMNSDLAAFGLSVVSSENGLVIERVAPGSWAHGMGLTAGNRIVHVGKARWNRLSLDAMLEVIRGERLGIAELTVENAAGSESRTITLPDSLPSVHDVGMERNGIGTIRIGHFQRTTPQEFDSALLRLRSEGLRLLVLDLRGNPGGSFPAAVQIAERFLDNGVIVSTEGQLLGLTKTFTAQNSPLFDGPVVALIDADTASAAEVLAGALRTHSRAILVGQATFGKDSIQRLLHLSDGAAIRLTLARFLLPNGKAFVGVEPHIVEPRRDPMRDYQFEAALEQAARMIATR